LIGFLLLFLAVVTVDWSNYKFFPKKIGNLVEFEEYTKAETKSHGYTASKLEARLLRIEKLLAGENVQIAEEINDDEILTYLYNDKLVKLLVGFLEKYDDYSFNAARISIWGSQKQLLYQSQKLFDRRN